MYTTQGNESYTMTTLTMSSVVVVVVAAAAAASVAAVVVGDRISFERSKWYHPNNNVTNCFFKIVFSAALFLTVFSVSFVLINCGG